jgi:alkaline phosphatase D
VFTERDLRADFRTLPYVRTEGAQVATAASFITEDRGNTLHPA